MDFHPRISLFGYGQGVFLFLTWTGVVKIHFFLLRGLSVHRNYFIVLNSCSSLVALPCLDFLHIVSLKSYDLQNKHFYPGCCICLTYDAIKRKPVAGYEDVYVIKQL